MRRLAVISALCLLFRRDLGAQQISAESVRVFLVTRSGDPLPLAKVSISGLGSSVDLRGTATPGEYEIEKIPVGEYLVKALLPGFTSMSTRVQVVAPASWFVLALDVAEESPAFTTEVKGTVRFRDSEPSPKWMRVRAVFADDTETVAINKTGGFTFRVRPGAFTFWVMAGNRTCEVKRVNINGVLTFRIDFTIQKPCSE